MPRSFSWIDVAQTPHQPRGASLAVDEPWLINVEFGVLQIVGIALKAISPAVNDPTTALGCVDQLGRILIRFVSRELPEPRLYDLHGVARVSIQWIDFEHLVDSAFEQIRTYAKTDIAVSLRLLRALGDIAINRATLRSEKLSLNGAGELLKAVRSASVPPS